MGQKLRICNCFFNISIEFTHPISSIDIWQARNGGIPIYQWMVIKIHRKSQSNMDDWGVAKNLSPRKKNSPSASKRTDLTETQKREKPSGHSAGMFPRKPMSWSCWDPKQQGKGWFQQEKRVISWLVGGWKNPLWKNMSSSIGMIIATQY